MSIAVRRMENTLAYPPWMGRFAENSFPPILPRNDLGPVRQVLDVCYWPGSSTDHFADVNFIGHPFNKTEKKG